MQMTFRDGLNYIEAPPDGHLTLGMEWEIPMNEKLRRHSYFSYEWAYTDYWCPRDHDIIRSHASSKPSIHKQAKPLDSLKELSEEMRKVTKGMCFPNDLFRFDVGTELCLLDCHLDSGGWEVTSPVATSVKALKDWAQKVKEIAVKADGFTPIRVPSRNTCGIHVHVGECDTRKVADLANFLLHYKQDHVNKDFLQALSGRKSDVPWGAQGISDWINPEHVEFTEYFRSTVQPNNNGTVEFRLFAAEAKRVDVAIEFAHALTSWIETFSLTGTDNRSRWRWFKKNYKKDFNLPAFKRWLQRQDYPTLHRNKAINSMIG